MHNHEHFLIDAEANIHYFGTRDTKKVKRIERLTLGVSELEIAYNRGGDHASRGRPARNPYPAGKRRENYDYGYAHADPMGDYHGRNA